MRDAAFCRKCGEKRPGSHIEELVQEFCRDCDAIAAPSPLVNAVQDALSAFASHVLPLVAETYTSSEEVDMLRLENRRLQELLGASGRNTGDHFGLTAPPQSHPPMLNYVPENDDVKAPSAKMFPFKAADPDDEVEAPSLSKVMPKKLRRARTESEVETRLESGFNAGQLSKVEISQQVRAIQQDDNREVNGRITLRAGAGGVFPDREAMLNQVRSELTKPAYDVSQFYWDTGYAQRIAVDYYFEMTTLTIITINAIWLAIDADFNKNPDATPLTFLVVDNFFCAYFTIEWIVRFGAFQYKVNCCRDPWFVFDSILCLLMVLETWVLPICMILVAESGSNFDASGFRLLRLLRLTRTARMAKVLRAMPELLIMIKGMIAAARSVFFTLVLLMIIIYIYAIAYRQITSGLEWKSGQTYFRTVPDSMLSLLLHGTFPDFAAMCYELAADHWGLLVLQLTFVLLSSVTVLNMLVGVLCEVVSTVAIVEREGLAAQHVKAHFMAALRVSDVNGDERVGKEEFQNLLANPDTVNIMSMVGVDVLGLLELSDFFFKDEKTISFDDFFTTVLQLRGTNTATVKDIVDTRKFIMQELADFEERVCSSIDGIDKKPGIARRCSSSSSSESGVVRGVLINKTRSRTTSSCSR
jgi:voltage-gated sodium channel